MSDSIHRASFADQTVSVPNVADLCWLCIDTCSAYLCVALGSGADFDSRVQPGKNRSSIDLVPVIKELLRKRGVKKPDAILVTVGPGSFTGTRIGVSTARNLAMLWKIPVASIYSLQLYAEPLLSPGPEPLKAPARDSEFSPFMVSLDGKQNRFYSLAVGVPESVYHTRQQQLQDLRPEEVLAAVAPGDRIYCDEWALLKERLPEPREVLPLPQPEPHSFFRLLERAQPGPGHYESLIPVYVRSDPATAKYPEGFHHKPGN